MGKIPDSIKEEILMPPPQNLWVNFQELAGNPLKAEYLVGSRSQDNRYPLGLEASHREASSDFAI
jgi:hypothetical protein